MNNMKNNEKRICDSCGNEFEGEGFPVYDENYTFIMYVHCGCEFDEDELDEIDFCQ